MLQPFHDVMPPKLPSRKMELQLMTLSRRRSSSELGFSSRSVSMEVRSSLSSLAWFMA